MRPKPASKTFKPTKLQADEEEKDLRMENILLEERMKALRVFSGTA